MLYLKKTENDVKWEVAQIIFWFYMPLYVRPSEAHCYFV